MAKFGMTGAELVESAESYLIYTSAGRTATGLGVKKMRKEIVKIILEGLREFLPVPVYTHSQKMTVTYCRGTVEERETRDGIRPLRGSHHQGIWNEVNGMARRRQLFQSL